MFDSGVKAGELIAEINTEADIAIPVPDGKYLEWLSALEQLLYSEFIQEQRWAHVEPEEIFGVGGEVDKEERIQIPFNKITPKAGESPVRYEDIYTIYAGETQLIQSTPTSGIIFPDTWYKLNENTIGLNMGKVPSLVDVVYFVRPKIKEETDGKNQPVYVPYEFLELVRSKLRGEAYKLANEDNLAAKWINDYNVNLQSFQGWIARRKSNFGM